MIFKMRVVIYSRNQKQIQSEFVIFKKQVVIYSRNQKQIIMSFKIPRNLITFNNTKTIKGEKFGWKTGILYLAPFTQNETGKNVCSHATKGCAEACLFGSGRGSLSNVEKGRVNKTNYFFAMRDLFLTQLVSEISFLDAQAKMLDEKLCIRLNGTSDLAWEKFKVRDDKTIMELFPDVKFYDYTKNHLRFKRVLPKNYHLTFSRSESNDDKVDEILAMGQNVAIVFDEIPETYKGYKVVNGDLNDLTFLQPEGVVIGLKYKRMTKKGADNNVAFESGFALRVKDLVQATEKVA